MFSCILVLSLVPLGLRKTVFKNMYFKTHAKISVISTVSEIECLQNDVIYPRWEAQEW